MNTPSHDNVPSDPVQDAARDDLTDLIAGAGDTLLEDFDPRAARQRFDRTLERHRMLARGGAVAIVGMTLSVWLLPPWLARATGDPGLVDGGRVAFAVMLATAIGSVAWWLTTRRRLARALDEGPPAMQRTVDHLQRQAGRWDRVIAALGLISGPGILLVAIEKAPTIPWWFTAWIGLGGGLVLADAIHRALRVHREDRAARRGRRA